MDWPNHVDVWREWRRALSGARMHHGWILAGKSGLGKRDFAMTAARELVGEEGVAQPTGAHPDILTLTHLPKDDKEEKKRDEGKAYQVKRNIAVGQIRDMQRRLNTRPTLGARRAIIIDPADDMEPSASNALLKSLEEPPQGTFFILIAHRPSRLLPTIRSRCRLLRFPTLSNEDLSRLIDQHGGTAGAQARDAAIDAAEGSFGAAMRFLEQDMGPLADLIGRLLREGDAAFQGRGELSRAIGPRADRGRIQAVLELAQALVAENARNSSSPMERGRLIEVHSQLVTLAGQAPTYNFDNGLLAMEIGTLLSSVSAGSEHANG
ncbi:DNA polymerase III subunit delta' [Erythrobacter crassostreae]|uniref:DNA polymerase III subunit delta n=1 Tax=Erythrobacter crassostreae TaxID=2828328 RepID=A0A9X1JLF8_9SPHN|nr:DNA polymerase III subunit delta' [Erythrobacter crassostrea]MBV7260021.1 DNA polymerase III subunit delta' [Erythrobacter crassostrea]